jgi:hypothetical protein
MEMIEKDLLREVMRFARANGWNVSHFGNSVKFVRKGDSYLTLPDKDAVGFPDLVMVREGVLVFAELKSEKGRIRDEQALWIADLHEVAKRNPGVSMYLWRPEHWESGAIQELLT